MGLVLGRCVRRLEPLRERSAEGQPPQQPSWPRSVPVRRSQLSPPPIRRSPKPDVLQISPASRAIVSGAPSSSSAAHQVPATKLVITALHDTWTTEYQAARGRRLGCSA